MIFKKEKTKGILACARCKLIIDMNEDKWVNTRDFDKGKVKGEVNVHLDCWRNQYKEKFQEEFDKKVKQISPVMQQLMGGLMQNVQKE